CLQRGRCARALVPAVARVGVGVPGAPGPRRGRERGRDHDRPAAIRVVRSRCRGGRAAGSGAGADRLTSMGARFVMPGGAWVGGGLVAGAEVRALDGGDEQWLADCPPGEAVAEVVTGLLERVVVDVGGAPVADLL